MADSKEDMEKWLTVLTTASKGEVIQKTKQHHLAPMGEVVMRKKSGSMSTQRTSSVLGQYLVFASSAFLVSKLNSSAVVWVT